MDTEGLLKSLIGHKVRYVAIGATAFPFHGYARATLDIDIFIDRTPANARRTLAALAEVRYDASDITDLSGATGCSRALGRSGRASPVWMI
jgi:hypothetical protein